MVLDELLLIHILVASLVLHKRSRLREERAVVVARAKVLRKAGELPKVEATTSMLLVVVVVIVVVVVVVVAALLVVVVVHEALGHVADLVEVEAGHFE